MAKDNIKEVEVEEEQERSQSWNWKKAEGCIDVYIRMRTLRTRLIKTPSDARATVAKVKRIKKPYARKIQILTVMEQRADG